MKKILQFLTFALAVSVAHPAESQVSVKKKVLLLGDSMAEGMSRCFSLLATSTGYRKESAFLRGSTTEHWAKRIDKILQDSSPDLVLVSLGTNDAAGQDSSGKKRQRIYKIVSAIKKRGARVLWILPPALPAAFSGQDEVGRVLREELVEGERFESSRLPLSRAEDGIHMTAVGYADWIREVWNKLEKSGIVESQPVEITVGNSTSLPLTSSTPGCLVKSNGP